MINKYTTYLNFTFLGAFDSRLYFRPDKLYFFELNIKFLIGHTTHKNFMTDKFGQDIYNSFPQKIAS
jgi:hypothetical protein